jgi:hypothetical protein
MRVSIGVALSLVIGFFGCGNSQNSQESIEYSENNEGSEWTVLFNDSSFDGWTRYGGGPVGGAWKIENGTVYLDATNKDNWGPEDGGDIVTVGEFENFHFQIEWKVAENANSGIIFLVHETPEYSYPWMTGLEMQILDNDGHPDAKIHTHRAGDLYDLIASSEETVKPVGEWNLAEIRIKDGDLDLFLNDVNIVSTTMWTEEWDELVAKSKFKDMPGFAKFRKGKIALQDHGDEVWFRNARIKEL